MHSKITLKLVLKALLSKIFQAKHSKFQNPSEGDLEQDDGLELGHWRDSALEFCRGEAAQVHQPPLAAHHAEDQGVLQVRLWRRGWFVDSMASRWFLLLFFYLFSISLSSLFHPSFIPLSSLFHPSFIPLSSLFHPSFIPLSSLFHPSFIPFSSLFHPFFLSSSSPSFHSSCIFFSCSHHCSSDSNLHKQDVSDNDTAKVTQRKKSKPSSKKRCCVLYLEKPLH